VRPPDYVSAIGPNIDALRYAIFAAAKAIRMSEEQVKPAANRSMHSRPRKRLGARPPPTININIENIETIHLPSRHTNQRPMILWLNPSRVALPCFHQRLLGRITREDPKIA
jgi:hypothetical protein